MDTAVMIFAVGLGGVFLGMGMLYVCIRMTTLIAGRFLDSSMAEKGGKR